MLASLLGKIDLNKKISNLYLYCHKGIKTSVKEQPNELWRRRLFVGTAELRQSCRAAPATKILYPIMEVRICDVL